MSLISNLSKYTSGEIISTPVKSLSRSIKNEFPRCLKGIKKDVAVSKKQFGDFLIKSNKESAKGFCSAISFLRKTFCDSMKDLFSSFKSAFKVVK